MSKKKYSDKAQEKVGEVMKEFKEGKLKSSSGKKVTDKKQAILPSEYRKLKRKAYKCRRKKERLI